MSPVGKETLLKAIVTAIPTYAMSCFLMPYILLDHITKSLANSGGSVDRDKRNISWISWDKVTQAKQDGGIGIRYLRGQTRMETS